MLVESVAMDYYKICYLQHKESRNYIISREISIKV